MRAVARTATRPGTILAAVGDDPERLVRLEVATHLAGLPDEAAGALLADPDLRVREAAARAAGTGQVGALAVLLVEDPSNDVRRAAAQTLGGLGDERIADLLVSGIEDPDAVVRAAVLRGLKRLLMRAGAVSRLRVELVSDRAERRRAAVYALACLETLEATEDVARLADDPDPDVRLALIHTAHALLPDPGALIHHLAADLHPAVRDSAEIWLLREASAGS